MRYLDRLQLLLKVFMILQELNKSQCVSNTWATILRIMKTLLHYKIYTGQEILLESHLRYLTIDDLEDLKLPIAKYMIG